MVGNTLNTGANILIACALAVVAYSIGGRLGLFGGRATQHSLVWYLPDVVLGMVTIFYLGDFRETLSYETRLGFACAITARLIWRSLLMLRVHHINDDGLGAKAVNVFCWFAIAALTFKAWQCVVDNNSDRAGLQGINQILGIICLIWFIAAIFWLVGKPRDKHQ